MLTPFRSGTTLAASASSSNIGNDIILVGLISQVITLSIFGLLTMDVSTRIIKHKGDFSPTAKEVHCSRHFRGLPGATLVAYLFILIRCVYRIPEMSGGWSSPVMQNQILFIVLDGVMCVVAALVLNVFHPGMLFNQSCVTTKAGGNDSLEMLQMS
jgi:RTA1 like protein